MIKLTILLLYALAAGLLIRALTRSDPGASKIGMNFGLLTGLVALGVHSGALWQALLGDGELRLSLSGVIGLVAWQIGLFAWIAAAFTRLRGLGALLFPVVGLLALVSGSAAAPGGASEVGWQVQSHVILSLLSYGLFTLAALLALLMRLQEKAIKGGRPGRLMRLMPPLEAAELAMFVCVGLGFFLLSLAIFSGLIFVENMLAQHLVHKTVLSFLAWLLFAILLFGRWRFGWRGQTAAAWTLGGFAALILAYFGSRFVLELILGRQWG